MVDIVQLLGVVERNALLFGAVFLAAGFLLGLLRRAFALVLLGFVVLSIASVVVTQLAQHQDLTATLIGLVVGIAGPLLLYRAWRILLVAIQFVVFLAAWFLLLYSAYGIAFTTDIVLVALWLVGTGASLFFTHRASVALFRTNPSWKQAPARVDRG